MDIIIKEKNEQEKIPGGKAFIFIAGFIFIINLIVTLINRLKPLAAGIASIVLIMAVVWVTYEIMSRKVTEYNYILTDHGVIFEKVLGRREKPVLEVSFERIDHLLPEAEAGRYDKYHYFLCNRKAPNKYVLGYSDKGKTLGVVFCPSTKMVKSVQKRIGQVE